LEQRQFFTQRSQRSIYNRITEDRPLRFESSDNLIDGFDLIHTCW
jgi:hypothetical protein